MISYEGYAMGTILVSVRLSRLGQGSDASVPALLAAQGWAAAAAAGCGGGWVGGGGPGQEDGGMRR